MAELEGAITLDASSALSTIDDLETAFAATADKAGQALADALGAAVDLGAEALAGLGDTVPAVAVEVDSTQIDTAQADLAALDDSPPSVSVDVDTASIDAATGSVHELDDALSEIAANSVDVPVDASGADAAAASLGNANEAAKGLGAEGVGAVGAFGAGLNLAKGNVTGLTGALGGVLAPVAAAGAGVAALFEAAEKGVAAEERLTLVFGDQADAVKSIDVGGLTGQLSDLAQQSGSSGAQLKQAVANIGQVGITAGKASSEVVPFAQNVAALALRATALNPALGQAGDVTNTLFRVLGRGGPFLQRYGYSLTAAQIAAEALRETGKASAKDLTAYEKSVAGATLVTRQLGGAIGTDFARGAEQGAVKLKALKAELAKGLAEAGKPLVEPIIDALTELVPVGVQVAGALGDAAQVFIVPLKLAAPILSEIAGLLDSLPIGPIAAAAAAFITVNTALKLGQSATTFLVDGLKDGVAALQRVGVTSKAAAVGVQTLAVAEGEAAVAGAAAGRSITAAFGPIAIGIAVVVGLGSALGVFGGEASEAEDATKAWGDAMRQAADAALAAKDSTALLSGDISQATDAFKDLAAAKVREQFEGFGSVLADAHVTFRELSDAAVEGGPRFAELATRIFTTARETGVSTERMIDLTTALNATGEASAKFTDETLAQAKVQIANADAHDVLDIAQLKVSGHLGDLTEQEQVRALALLEEHAALKDVTEAEDKHSAAQARAAREARTATRTLDNTVDKIGELADAYDEARAALDRYLGKPLDAAQQELDLASAVADVRDSFEESKGAIDSSTGLLNLQHEAGREVASSLGDAAKSALDYASSLAEQGKQKEAVAFVAAYRDTLIAQAGKSKEARAAVAAYLDTLGLTPDRVDTLVTATGLDKRTKDVQAYDRVLALLPREKQVLFVSEEDPAKRAQLISDYIQNDLPDSKRVQFVADLEKLGYEFVRGELRKLEEPRTAPVKALASVVDAERRLDGLTRGRDQHITAKVIDSSRRQAERDLEYLARRREAFVDVIVRRGGATVGFAGGGRPPLGDVVTVGEKGPERVIFDRPATIIPADRTASLVRAERNLATMANGPRISVDGLGQLTSVLRALPSQLERAMSRQGQPAQGNGPRTDVTIGHVDVNLPGDADDADRFLAAVVRSSER